MTEPLEVAPGVSIPAAALEFKAVRASGPGGQSVNKVASKVVLRVALAAIRGLPAGALDRLRRLAASRLDAEGRLRVTAQRHRDQPRNLAEARRKLRALLRRALAAPPPRKPTRPSAAARERRLLEKKLQARKKRNRQGGLD